jgi:hypothetical protein
LRAGRLLIPWLLAACAPSASSDLPTTLGALELRLERALAIEGELEPSGLLLDEGKLLMVADKHDGTIFELRLREHTASADPFLKLASIAPSPLDLEGLARDEDGSWLLVSEAQGRVLRVTSSGATTWATASLERAGAQVGLFAKRGAGLEGITMLSDGALLLAAEREPRGLLESSPNRDEWRAQAMPFSERPAAPPRPNDWSDLTLWRGRVFALARNSHLVVELRKANGVWREGQAWSYARSENDRRLAYEDRKFGLGEGLAIDDRHVYIALDNNRGPRVASRHDHRPLLLVFQRPD